jgi:hypothetical protein
MVKRLESNDHPWRIPATIANFTPCTEVHFQSISGGSIHSPERYAHLTPIMSILISQVHIQPPPAPPRVERQAGTPGSALDIHTAEPVAVAGGAGAFVARRVDTAGATLPFELDLPA